MGLGKSGMATARALLSTGVRIHAWDDNPALREAARQEGIPLADLTDPNEKGVNWHTLQAVVWSPGIAHTYPQPHPVASLARRHGVPLFCDIELLVRAHKDSFFVGVTGTNGKSTTTALIHHVLNEAHLPTEVGGNLGYPALSLKPLPFHGTYVLELSSYQLELVPSLACDVAVMLNITPDHLARHGGMDGYIAAKRHVFQTDARPQTAIVGVDDDPSRQMFNALRRQSPGRVIPISVRMVPTGGIGISGGHLVDATESRPRAVFALAEAPTLPGAHNAQNMAAAYAAARARGVDARTIARAFASFPGLAHRQELVATVDGVRFVNDSKATNADAADKALGCYDAIYWIAGGQPKEGGIASLTPHFPRIRHAFLIGQAAPAFAQTLAGQVTTHACETLDRAVAEAAALAWREGCENPVVLLSPACASWDQFRSFEHRGEVFRALVGDLARTRGGTP
ncbi:UDP-N-acetylmuramoyl-L-alanine--D-glutamate ligase [Pararhodospirillum oryzae]|nr:UDP-N-acetylmuramoyl-L-alanine--D-glutamate ligase [Pararhodospirillum oryzae]